VYQQECVYAAEDMEIIITDNNAVLNGVNIPKITCPEYLTLIQVINLIKV
jgi:hypothetical protein